jgi:predicted nuclease with TOPRIM domain
MSVAEMNGDLQRKVGPLQKEAQQLRTRLNEIEQEIRRYVKALGQGRLSIGRLETEIGALEIDRDSLQKRVDEIERKINESSIREFNTDLLRRTLQDFRTAFTSLTPPDQSEALQCVLKGVTVHAQKLGLEVFELKEFPSSQNRKEWLPGLDSN